MRDERAGAHAEYTDESVAIRQERKAHVAVTTRRFASDRVASRGWELRPEEKQPGATPHGCRTVCSQAGVAVWRPELGVGVVNGELVHQLAELLADLEMDRVLPFDGDLFAGLRVSTDVGAMLFEREGAESPDLDAMPLCEGFAEGVEDAVDRLFGALFWEVRVRREPFDEFALRHALLGCAPRSMAPAKCVQAGADATESRSDVNAPVVGGAWASFEGATPTRRGPYRIHRRRAPIDALCYALRLTVPSSRTLGLRAL